MIPSVIGRDRSHTLHVGTIRKPSILKTGMTLNLMDNNTAMRVWRCPLARVSWTKNSHTGNSHAGRDMVWRTVITYKNTAPAKNGRHVAKTQIRDI